MNAELPLYTAALAALLAVLQWSLMLVVGLYRTRIWQPIGLTEDKVLERLVRRHGNLAENAGLIIASLGVYEVLVGQTGTTFWLATAFAAGRLAHAVGFTSLAGSHGDSLAGSHGEMSGLAGKLAMGLRAGGAVTTGVTGLALGIALAFEISDRLT